MPNTGSVSDEPDTQERRCLTGRSSFGQQKSTKTHQRGSLARQNLQLYRLVVFVPDAARGTGLP
jgi:hypothetical protein